MPTVKMVRWTNYLFAIFAFAAVAAVPKVQALVLLVAFILQAVASRWTLPGAS